MERQDDVTLPQYGPPWIQRYGVLGEHWSKKEWTTICCLVIFLTLIPISLFVITQVNEGKRLDASCKYYIKGVLECEVDKSTVYVDIPMESDYLFTHDTVYDKRCIENNKPNCSVPDVNCFTKGWVDKDNPSNYRLCVFQKEDGIKISYDITCGDYEICIRSNGSISTARDLLTALVFMINFILILIFYISNENDHSSFMFIIKENSGLMLVWFVFLIFVINILSLSLVCIGVFLMVKY